MNANNLRPIEILLVDDDEADIELTKRALKKDRLKINMHICHDGIEALEFLNKTGSFKDVPTPDIVLLDLNMPRKDGRETLKDIKANPKLKSIPIIILTTSRTENDIAQSYELGCNCIITKPVNINEFNKVVSVLSEFWFSIVHLPPKVS